MFSPIFVHCLPDQDWCPRFDSILMPNATLASLLRIAQQLLGRDACAIDETYITPYGAGRERATLNALVPELVEQRIRQGDKPLVLCTILGYNAEGSLAFLRGMKQEFRNWIRTGVGGQLVRHFPHAYLAKPYLDHVAVGDAEVTFPQILSGKRFASGSLRVSTWRHYAGQSYDGYFNIRQRLADMSLVRFGPFSNMRQLSVESVRGCAWAYHSGTCHFCAIDGVDQAPVFRPLHEQFALEKSLQERFNLTWLFNVSNQFLPVLSARGKQDFLRLFIQAREAAGIRNLAYYVYLTTASITPETAPLLRKAGVRMAFVGLDGWDEETRRSLNKPRGEADRMLQACQEHDLYVRLGLVIGQGATRANLQALPKIVERMLAQYGSHILTMDPLLEIVLPGSPVWRTIEAQAHAEKWQDVLAFYAQARTQGFLPWPAQCAFDRACIERTHPELPFAELVQARDATYRIIERSAAVPITVEHGGAFKS